MFELFREFFCKDEQKNSRELEEISSLLLSYSIPTNLIDVGLLAIQIEEERPENIIRYSAGPAESSKPHNGKQYPKGLEETVKTQIEETQFYKLLCGYIDATGKKESAIYKKAMIDKGTFSRIRKGYTPNRISVLRLAFVLELNLSEAEKLLRAAGYTFNPNDKFDKFICFFLEAFQRGEKYKWRDLNDWCYELTGKLLDGID